MKNVPHYDAILNGATVPEKVTSIIHCGDLFLPSGRVYCCDPFLALEVGPLEASLAPGNYPVRLALTDLPDWGQRVALAGLVLSPEKVVDWAEASYRLNGTEDFRYRVDAGLACFMDVETEQLFRISVERFYCDRPSGNYYDDVLATQFAQNVASSDLRRDGDWNVHFPVAGNSLNVVMFASGLGDGIYPCYLGLSERAEVCLVVTDFGLI